MTSIGPDVQDSVCAFPSCDCANVCRSTAERLQFSLKWALNEIRDREWPSRTTVCTCDSDVNSPDITCVWHGGYGVAPEHECGYFNAPEQGVCGFHDQWAKAFTLAEGLT